MEMALGDVLCFEVMREWYDVLSGLNPPLSENEMLLYDATWVLEQMGRPDRIDVQEGLCVMFWSLLLLFCLFILSIFSSPEQLIPSEPIWEWSYPLFFDEDK